MVTLGIFLLLGVIGVLENSNSSGGGGSDNGPQIATTCVTPEANCAMQVSLPVGDNCVCVTPNGTFSGTAQ
jgi:hypothetical protein